MLPLRAVGDSGAPLRHVWQRKNPDQRFSPACVVGVVGGWVWGGRMSSKLTAPRQAAATAGAGNIFIRRRSHSANKHTYGGSLATCSPTLPTLSSALPRRKASVPGAKTGRRPATADPKGACRLR